MTKSFPINRVGRLAKATTGGEHYSASKAESGVILKALFDDAESIQDELVEAAKKAALNSKAGDFKEEDFELLGIGTKSSKNGANGKANSPVKDQVNVLMAPPKTQEELELSPPHITASSPHIDFAEIHIRVGKFEFLLRCCVTICVDTKVMGIPLRPGHAPYSKLWTRILLYKVGGKQATDVPVDTVKDFFVVSNEICTHCVESLVKPYENEFTRVKKAKTKISLHQSFILWTTGADSNVCKEMIKDLAGGMKFGKLLSPTSERNYTGSPNHLAETMLGLAKIHPDLSEDKPDSKSIEEYEDLAKRPSFDVCIWEDSLEYAGIVFMDVTEERAIFIGMAHFPLWLKPCLQEGNLKFGKKWLQPANHMSASLIRDAASEF